jgi:hypothetical protein
MTRNGKPTLDGCEVLPPMDPTGTPNRASSNPGKPKKQTRDRFRVLNTFVDFTKQSLKRNEIAVWLILYRDTKNGIAATSQVDMARRAGIHRRTVCRALKRLEKRRLLTVDFRGGLHRGMSKYRLQPLPTDE